MKHEQGFTLVEIVITIALVSFIALMAMPLAGTMSQRAEVDNTQGLLRIAVAGAKTAALRNEIGAVAGENVAAVCISDSNLLSLEIGAVGTPPICDDPDGLVVWSAQLSNNSSIKTNESGSFVAASCMCFSNKGLLSGDACGAGACVSNTVFQLSVNDHSTEIVSIF